MEEKIIKRLILVGKAASGKDYARKILEKSGLIYGVSYTSRPSRDGEVEGVDYYFIEKDEAVRMAEASEFYECVEFNSWFYGTSIKEFERANLFIMTPSGISKLKTEHRKESLIVFLDIPEDVLLIRLSNRKDADNAQRRLEADKKDFKDFIDFDLVITNPNFTITEVKKLINEKASEIFHNNQSINI
jgi:guanylate kinase